MNYTRTQNVEVATCNSNVGDISTIETSTTDISNDTTHCAPPSENQMPQTRKEIASSFFFNSYLELVEFNGTTLFGRALLDNYKRKQSLTFSTRTRQTILLRK